MDIRGVTPDDAAAIAELLGHLGYPAEPGTIPGRLRGIAAGGGHVMMAWHGDRPAGLIGVQPFAAIHSAERIAYITALVVAPAVRGQGAGRALVEAAADWARAAGCIRLSVTSAEHRDGAHEFYPRVGFPYTGRRFTRSLGERE